MSCMLLEAATFEALAESLCAHRVPVPVARPAGATVAEVWAWAELVWDASRANAEAYAHRYNEAATMHPLQLVHGTVEVFAEWLAWAPALGIAQGRPARHRTVIGTIKLIRCMVYQLADAPTGSSAAEVGERLDGLSLRLALSAVEGLPAYWHAPWGDDLDEVTP